MKHSDYGLNLKAKSRQLWIGEFVSTLDEYEDYNPQIPEPELTAKPHKLIIKEQLYTDYYHNNHYGNRKEWI